MNTAVKMEQLTMGRATMDHGRIADKLSSLSIPHYKFGFGTLFLFMLVLLSGLAVIYLADLNRKLDISIDEGVSTQNQLHVNWTKLLLEQSTWATEARIQNIAVSELGMQTPTDSQTVMIRKGNVVLAANHTPVKHG